MSDERLTYRDENGTAIRKKNSTSSYIGTIYEEEKVLNQEVLDKLADFEDKKESGEFGNIAAERHRAEVAEQALKNVINEYTYDGEITVPGCEECDITFGRPTTQCLQNQFNRLLEQAEKELQEK